MNKTWLVFGNEKRCSHANALRNLGFVSWVMGRNYHFAIGDTIYMFMSDGRRVRFKLRVTEANCPRQDQAYWYGEAPDDITYKLELVKEYKGDLLDEMELKKHGFKGGRSIETPSYKNKELMDYIDSVFDAMP